MLGLSVIAFHIDNICILEMHGFITFWNKKRPATAPSACEKISLCVCTTYWFIGMDYVPQIT